MGRGKSLKAGVALVWLSLLYEGLCHDDENVLTILAVPHGVGFMLAAGQLVSLYGLETSPSTLLVARLFGGALLAWGAIVWFARDFRDEAAVPAVLMATGVAEVISLGVAAIATLAGTMNAMGWVAVLIYLFGTGDAGTSCRPGPRCLSLKKGDLT